MTGTGTGAFARATLLAELAAGTLDITAAVVENLEHPARVIFQSVASGWLGRATYEGGWPTAWLGLASHFAIMLVIAAIYMTLASLRPQLRRRWLTAGLVWGGVVWVVMTFVVVPLSASPLPLPDVSKADEGVLTHMVCVGLPMAWIARRVLGAPAAA
jgi:uncharacterized membrane protein YagU involved in acid resistance